MLWSSNTPFQNLLIKLLNIPLAHFSNPLHSAAISSGDLYHLAASVVVGDGTFCPVNHCSDKKSISFIKVVMQFLQA